jgi:hypothetical protein
LSRLYYRAPLYFLLVILPFIVCLQATCQTKGNGITAATTFDEATESDQPILRPLVPKLDTIATTTNPSFPDQASLTVPIDESKSAAANSNPPKLATDGNKLAGNYSVSETAKQNDLISQQEASTPPPLHGTSGTTEDTTLAPANTPGSASSSKPTSAPQADPSTPPNGSASSSKPTPAPQAAQSLPAPASEEPPRRSLPAPMDGVFPLTEWVGGPLIGVPDTDPTWPLEKAIWAAFPVLKKNRIKIYGWVDPSYNASTSKHSNVPLSYNIIPNRLELDQLIGRIERVPDTVQREHYDWGFRYSGLFGIDYRYTAASGYGPSDGQLLRHNDLYGYDYPEAYALIYEPHFAKGMVTKIGRYISPPDIEAQLAPDNYLFTHSLMFTYDAYTHTGIQQTIKLSDQWMVQGGIHAGTDTAPWARAAHPTMELFARWVSKSNRDSLYGGVDSFNGGSYKFQKDNLQQFNLTWGHKISRRINTMTEGYYLYTFDALKGGTVSNGPVKGFGGGGGPGAPLPGYSQAFGLLNYTNIKLTDHDYITVRPVDYLFDPRGWRTGYATTYSSWTIGFIHRFSDLLCIRPEVRYERALTGSVTPYDNGTRRSQFTFSVDVIQRF